MKGEITRTPSSKRVVDRKISILNLKGEVRERKTKYKNIRKLF